MTTDELWRYLAGHRNDNECELCGASTYYHDGAPVFLYRAYDETARCDRCTTQYLAVAHWAIEDSTLERVHVIFHDDHVDPTCRWCRVAA